MRVLFLVTAFPRNETDVITPWMVEVIRRLEARGVAVEVLAPSYRGLGMQVVHGVTVHRFRYAPAALETLTHDQTAPDRIREKPAYAVLLPGYVVAGARAAARLARTGRFDVLHAFWPLPHGLLGLAAKRATRVPLVSTFFGVELTWMEAQLRFLAPVLRRIVRGSDAVTAISTHTAGLLRRLAPGAEPVIVPFGAAVEPRERPETPSPAPDAPLRLLFVGRLVERKGVHVLLDAVSRLAPDARPVVEIIGEGPERQRLERLTEELGVAERVRFRGFVPEEALEEALAGCDALVLPAVQDAKGDVEGLGVVLLEAMAFAKPVIASASGGIIDIVRDGENGLLVPPGDASALASAIEQLSGDRERAREMGRAGLEEVTGRFSWDAIVDRLVGVYESCVAPARTP